MFQPLCSQTATPSRNFETPASISLCRCCRVIFTQLASSEHNLPSKLDRPQAAAAQKKCVPQSLFDASVVLEILPCSGLLLAVLIYHIKLPRSRVPNPSRADSLPGFLQVLGFPKTCTFRSVGVFKSPPGVSARVNGGRRPTPDISHHLSLAASSSSASRTHARPARVSRQGQPVAQIRRLFII